jgi:tight adherence protein B
MDTLEALLASPMMIYVTHILTWSAIAIVGLVFKSRISQIIDIFTDRKSVHATDRERDRLVGIATGAVVFSALLLIDLSLILAITLGLVAHGLTPMILRHRRFQRYQRDFDQSLVESLATLSSSLRAGLTLKDALVVAVQNCPPVFSGEVTRVLKDYRFGISIDKALDGVRKRVQTQNANIAFGALIIGTQLGGKIPEVLTRIVSTIREVDRVEGRLKALTAQGKAQGVLLCSMPIIVTIGIYVMEREKIEFMMHSPVGKILIGIAVFLEIIGIAVTVKVMKLDV